MAESKKSGPEQELAQRTRRAFLTMGVAAAAGLAGWKWLRSRPEDSNLAGPFRSVLHVNEQVAEAYFDPHHLAPTFGAEDVEDLRVNGDVGLGDNFVPAQWHLDMQGLTGGETQRLTLADIQSLPRVEHRVQLKCIEGWSVVNQWAGARFSDFTQKFAPQSAKAKYVSMQTPDKEYFVGLDMPSALHPQTLLCYEMNGAPLKAENGAPLRLAIPVKYGIKNIKRIGTITYTGERPPDYWANDGYDWYAGL